ncbi:hypothetical protein FB45DRAFT_1118162 [Roridomyces roridus]|uniref:Uncharacterized protein n=1 Tax=Roridomyces roridus TaxID=1738132 RepID=A0AAD7FAI2_9AGAR|nr:hypothetical protein FB45DRAFT_1118162 [Roridomyces roridus]
MILSKFDTQTRSHFPPSRLCIIHYPTLPRLHLLPFGSKAGLSNPGHLNFQPLPRRHKTGADDEVEETSLPSDLNSEENESKEEKEELCFQLEDDEEGIGGQAPHWEPLLHRMANDLKPQISEYFPPSDVDIALKPFVRDKTQLPPPDASGGCAGCGGYTGWPGEEKRPTAATEKALKDLNQIHNYNAEGIYRVSIPSEESGYVGVNELDEKKGLVPVPIVLWVLRVLRWRISIERSRFPAFLLHSSCISAFNPTCSRINYQCLTYNFCSPYHACSDPPTLVTLFLSRRILIIMRGSSRTTNNIKLSFYLLYCIFSRCSRCALLTWILRLPSKPSRLAKTPRFPSPRLARGFDCLALPAERELAVQNQSQENATRSLFSLVGLYRRGGPPRNEFRGVSDIILFRCVDIHVDIARTIQQQRHLCQIPMTHAARARRQPSPPQRSWVLSSAPSPAALVAFIVFGSISLYVYRRRRAVANGRGRGVYPFGGPESAKQAEEDEENKLAMKISPFSVDLDDDEPELSALLSSQPTPPGLNTGTLPHAPALGPSRRKAYLEAQLQQLAISTEEEDVSVTFSPLSSIPPSEHTLPNPHLDPYVHPSTYTTRRTSPPLPPLPPPSPPSQLPPPTPTPGSSRRAVYLSSQLQKLNTDIRRGSAGGSLAFAPLSSVPSESTGVRVDEDEEEGEEEGSATPTQTEASPVSTVISPVVFRPRSEAISILTVLAPAVMPTPEPATPVVSSASASAGEIGAGTGTGTGAGVGTGIGSRTRTRPRGPSLIQTPVGMRPKGARPPL